MKSLESIAASLSGAAFSGPDLPVTAITCDSRNVKEGTLFVAIPGVAVDGHRFVEKAFQSGAVGAIVEDAGVLSGRPGIVVPAARSAWSELAGLWFDRPSGELFTAAVTGTNGKTTVQWLLSQALKEAGQSVVRIGTLGVYLDDQFLEEALTTPDAYDICRVLRSGKEQGATAAVLEASSHGLAQNRLDSLQLEVAIFTNLTRDHLDYHTSFEAYLASKARLFELLANSPTKRGAVLNADDPVGAGQLRALCDMIGLPVCSYGTVPEADIRIGTIELGLNGARVEILTGAARFEIQTPCIGKHNALNLASVWGALRLFGLTDQEIAPVLERVQPAPGRLESVGTGELGVYVDYAHTPDALENVLQALRPISKQKLWVVFGCGGDRDSGKRPQMGEIAARLADRVVVTSDNPRTEDPESIIKGILKSGITPHQTIVDRKQAILSVLSEAAPGDVILIAGKGHEDYQIIGTSKHHFSDQEIVRDFFTS